eukprot:6236327-Prymnesium_polylepis.1
MRAAARSLAVWLGRGLSAGRCATRPWPRGAHGDGWVRGNKLEGSSLCRSHLVVGRGHMPVQL